MRLLAQGDFRRLFAARTVSSFGDGFLPIALAFAVLDLTGSAADVGLVLAASALPSLGLLLAGGVLGDRVPRARLMLWADLTRMLVQATAGGLLLSGTAELWHLLALQIADGAAEGLHAPAASAVVPQVVAQHDLRPANALLGLAMGLSYTFGPAIGGILIAATSPG